MNLADAADVQLRARLLERIRKSDSETLRRVHNVLKSVGIDPVAQEIDLMRLSEYKNIETQLIAVLHKIAYHRMPSRSNSKDQSMRWRRYRATLPEPWMADVEWIRYKRGAPSVELSRRVQICQKNGWGMQRIVYVKPSTHYSTPVGNGLFTLIPFFRGQLIMQFTGSVHPDSESFVKNKKRRDYVLRSTYGELHFVINPLIEDATGSTVVANIAAYINEPSPPPWKRGSTVLHASRTATVSSYSHKAGMYTLSNVNGGVSRVRAIDVSHAPGRRPDRDTFESNTMWYNFPVPVKTLYRPTKRTRGGAYVYRRRPHTSIVAFDWSRNGFETRFTSFTDCKTGIFKTQAGSRIQAGHVVFMEEELFRGLERYGVVLKLKSHTITVQHYVLPDVVWRLPSTVLVGKLRVCSACRVSDDPLCTKCTVVPFPLVHACKDISADEELLCLYGSRIASRGLPCTILQDDEWKPRWNDH